MTSDLKAHIFKGHKALGEENCKISYNGYSPKPSLLIFSLELRRWLQATGYISPFPYHPSYKKSDINWRGELND